MTLTRSLDASPLTVIEVCDEDSLRALARAWNALAGDIPFRGWEWYERWWRHYRDPHSRLMVLSVSDERGEIVGIAPWYVRRSLRQGRVVRFLASGEVCSDYLTILAEPELADAVATRLADWLAAEGAGCWDLLDLEGVEQDDRAIASLGARFAEHNHWVDRQAELSCWRSELPGDWQKFLATLSKSRRDRTRGLLRRAVETGRAVVHRATTRDELEQAFAILVDLHQKRRRSLLQQGCFASKQFTEFHREIAAVLLTSGRLRMLWTELDGRPVAAEYSIVGGDTVYYYLGGFEPELADQTPGWLSLAASLKLAIEEGYRAYDFLRGDESYKASWRATARPLVRVRIVGSRKSARVRFSTLRACFEVKDRARRFLSRVKGS
jgi:CelD/BcsL family acetyltransferase involved in cellulose biosynthesis